MKNLIKIVIIASITSLFFQTTSFSEKIFFIAPDAGIVQEVLPQKLEQATWYPDGITPEVFSTSFITYNIAYCDPAGNGFNDTNHPNRKECLKTALNYISNILRTSGTIDILVEVSENDGTGAIAFAGSYIFGNQTTFSRCFSQLRLLNGTKPVANISEIQLTVDFGRNFYEDPNNNTPASNQLDLLSILIHEFTHGFGFLSFVEQNGQTSTTPDNKYLYTVFDQFIYKGNLALFEGSPPTFKGVPADTTSNQLVFKSSFIETFFGSDGLAIYSPDPFLDGTSLNHWDPDRTGINNAVMNPQYTAGTIIREYTTADLCALKSIGYSNIQLPYSEGEGPLDCQITNDISITQEISGEGVYVHGTTSYYVPGKAITVKVNLTKNTSEQILALGVSSLFPVGWKFKSLISGNTPAVYPTSDKETSNGIDPFDFAWISIPSFPFSFSFIVEIPSNMQSSCQITSKAMFRKTGPQLCSNSIQTTFAGHIQPQEGEGTSEGSNEGTHEGATEGNTTEGQTTEGMNNEGYPEGAPTPEGENGSTNGICGCKKSFPLTKSLFDFILIGMLLLLVSQKKSEPEK